MKLATVWHEEGSLYIKLTGSIKGAKLIRIECDAVDYSRLLEGKRIKGW